MLIFIGVKLSRGVKVEPPYIEELLKVKVDVCKSAVGGQKPICSDQLNCDRQFNFYSVSK